VDVKHENNDCGACGKPCVVSDRCLNGVCQTVLACSANGYTVCADGCFSALELQSDPRNCGGCAKVCQTNQVCVAGACVAYTTPVCTACPCAECGMGTICCPYPMELFPVCVTGAKCPV
jgi:hypothetical protein